jgi:dipeptide transport system ATP-binding protein
MEAIQPLLEVAGLSRHYRIARGLFRRDVTVHALEGVSFTLDEGRTLAIVGESGCGKSTLARQVTMIERPSAGSVKFDGIDVAHADRESLKRLRPSVQMVFQNPYASLNPRKQVMTLLQEPLVIAGVMTLAQRREAAEAMLEEVGLLPEHARRYPHMFSGGQRQRIAIARALMTRPRLLVADEPVSALDVSIQAQVLNLLMDLQQRRGVAYLFISHNLDVVRHIADSVAVMYLGRVVEIASRAALFAAPAHPYTRALFASTPRLDAKRAASRQVRGELPSPVAPPSGCAFHTRCPHAIERCRVELPLLEPFRDARVACHRVAELA